MWTCPLFFFSFSFCGYRHIHIFLIFVTSLEEKSTSCNLYISLLDVSFPLFLDTDYIIPWHLWGCVMVNRRWFSFGVRHEGLNLGTFWDAIYTELMDMGRTIQSLELQNSKKKFIDSSNFQTIICLIIHLRLLYTC